MFQDLTVIQKLTKCRKKLKMFRKNQPCDTKSPQSLNKKVFQIARTTDGTTSMSNYTVLVAFTNT